MQGERRFAYTITVHEPGELQYGLCLACRVVDDTQPGEATARVDRVPHPTAVDLLPESVNAHHGRGKELPYRSGLISHVNNLLVSVATIDSCCAKANCGSARTLPKRARKVKRQNFL